MRLLGFAVVLFVFVTACSSGEPVSAGESRVCDPGRSSFCTGLGGCAGGQSCKDDGSGFNDCVCGAPGSENDGSVTPDPNSDAGSSEDGGVEDPTCKGVVCDDSDPCTADTCSGGKCFHGKALEGVTCPGGMCQSGICTPCGNNQQGCCLGNTCAQYHVCLTPGPPQPPVCASCGLTDQPCCNTLAKCSASGPNGGQPRFCDNSSPVNLCRICGRAGQACCPAPLLPCSAGSVGCYSGTCL